MYKRIILAAAAVFVAQQALAIETCDRYNDSYGRTFCASKLFVESDKELNDVYKELRGVLNEQTRQSLRSTQLKWLKHRTSKCEVSPGNIDVDCSYKVNKQRTEFLRDRLRECKTGVCNPAQVSRQSW